MKTSKKKTDNVSTPKIQSFFKSVKKQFNIENISGCEDTEQAKSYYIEALKNKLQSKNFFPFFIIL